MPVLDEARTIAASLERVAAHQFDHTIVVDGGSSDESVAIAERFFAAEGCEGVVLGSSPGRARQMNRGAAASTADAILFLHCDCTLPRDARALIEGALASGAIGGAFRTRTVREGHPALVRRLLWLADVRSRYTRYPYGDQAIFVTAKAFAAVGRFPDQPILEDVELSRRLVRVGTMARLSAAVVVSSRRFRAAPFRTGLAMRTIPPLAWLGVPPAVLARYYRPVR